MLTTSQDTRRLAHRGDPASSHDAAAALDPDKLTRLQEAILEMLTEKPRAAFQLQKEYKRLRKSRGWPVVQLHSVNRRLSQLHGKGLVRPTGERIPTPDGATATVWEVAR